ncbi:MAG TPA: PH domain-containing protein, partial [Actinomycetes bacterium]|nr:PH domain-containing protein [Actinomycetes bacterium]
MSADGTPLRPLPVTWRPRRTRLVAYGTAAVVVAVTVVLAVALPEGSGGFRLSDRVGLILFGLGVAALLHVLARPRVRANEDGVTVVNV